MVYSLRDLLRECAAGDSGNLEDYGTVWRAAMRIAEDVLSGGRGIVIPNLGRITLVKNSLREGPGLKHRVFLLSDHFQRLYGVWFRKPGAGLLQTCTDFNYAKLCVLTNLDKDSAHTILATLIQTLGQAVSRGGRVRVTMGRVGVLTADDRRVHVSLLHDGSSSSATTSLCGANASSCDKQGSVCGSNISVCGSVGVCGAGGGGGAVSGPHRGSPHTHTQQTDGHGSHTCGDRRGADAGVQQPHRERSMSMECGGKAQPSTRRRRQHGNGRAQTAAPQATSNGTGGLQIDGGASMMYTQQQPNGRRVSRAEVPQLAASSKPAAEPWSAAVNEHSPHCSNTFTQTSPTDTQPTHTNARKQPRGSSNEATCNNLKRSSSYRNNCGNDADESHIRHLPNGIDVDLDMKPTSIFPTDVRMARTRCYAAPTNRAVEPGLQRTAIDEAYHRLEKRVARQMAEEERLRQSIKQREDSMDAKYANDRAQRKQRQIEWRQFLVKQVDELRERHVKEEEEKHKPLAPDGQDIKAYPLGTKFDRMKRTEVARSIQQTLEEQIQAKENAKRQAKQRELDQDEVLIDWVRYTDQQERNNRLARKIIQRETLLHDWGLQRAHAEETKKLRTAKLT